MPTLSSPSYPPGYTLGPAYVRSPSGGESLLGKGRAFTEFFDWATSGSSAIGEVVGRIMDGKAEQSSYILLEGQERVRGTRILLEARHRYV